MQQLLEDIQRFNSIADMERALEEVFETEEASDAEKRLHEGKFGRTFKLVDEEYSPLIVWMKIRSPNGMGRVIDGNQPHDAEVIFHPNEAPTRLEIGLASPGHQERLLLEAITQDGHGSPNSVYGRVGKGPNRAVETQNDRITASVSSIVRKNLCQLDEIALKKSGKNYEPSTTLVLSMKIHTTIRGQNLTDLKQGAQDILSNHHFSSSNVDVICDKNGLLACKS